MAQVLKETVRRDILESAKEELLIKGIKETSMRDIAKGAKMTVGNLYRYFSSKEDIIFTIIRRPLLMLNSAIEDLTNARVSFTKEVLTIGKSDEDIRAILHEIANLLAEIYARYPQEMQILMRDTSSNERFKDWLTGLIAVLLKENSNIIFSSDDVRDTYAYAIAMSVFAGIKECFLDDKGKTRELLVDYLVSFVGLLKVEGN